ncbi:MAG TPA: sigma-54 dependent transcriptional regulator [Nitrospirota bacterium]|nr:sigma-54 dependent transcriptional regulator [Nitrospirota bacterium]
MKPQILLIDDEAGTRFGFAKYLSNVGYEITETGDLAGGRSASASQTFDAILLDLNLPDGNGLDFIDYIRQTSPETPIIVITGSSEIPIAVDAMRRGADNFLTKPVDMASLDVFLKKTLELGSLKKVSSSRQRLEKREVIHFGENLIIRKVAELAQIAAETDKPVLITGETGTGKGLLAKWIHDRGDRAKDEFVDVNCSALRGELLARELFGNVRGAFTSADLDRQGLLDIANNGTLFLDEIGDMDVGVQAAFLKVLEDKRFRRLGDVKQRKSDFRLICATNRDLGAAIQQGAFRKDLYFRVNLLTIHIPPIRDRLDDLPGLIHHLLKSLRAMQVDVGDDVLQLLATYPWPGNIRELRNVLERALMLSRGGPLTPMHFAGLSLRADTDEICSTTLSQVEDAHILATLQRFGQDVNEAARHLRISRATLYRRLKKINAKPQL